MVQCHIAQSVKFVVQCRQYGSALMGDGIVCRHFFTLKAEIEDELIGGILKIAKATAGGSFVEMNLNVFFAQTLDYIKSHWEENYAFLVAQPNLAYIAKWKDAIKYHFRLRFPEKDAVPNHGLIMEVIASAVIGAYTYVLVGDYYVPDLKLPEERRPIGHWGRLHQSYPPLCGHFALRQAASRQRPYNSDSS